VKLNESPFELHGRRTVLLAEGDFSTFGAKTAVCYLRYRTGDVVGVVDSTCSQKTVQEALGFGGDIPVVSNVRQALELRPEVAIVGMAPQGGQLDGPFREMLREYLEAGLDVVCGLHTFIEGDAELSEIAKRTGARLWDVRRVGEMSTVSNGEGCTTGARTVLVTGSDCNVGKMTATIELHREAERRGLKTAWAATGQTGIMIRGRGVAIDRVIADFIGGASEDLVNEEGRGSDVVFVEGQGSLLNPGYSGVTLGLTMGVMPDCQVLVHAVSRTHIAETDVAMPPIAEVVRRCEAVTLPFKESPVVAIALNTAGCDDAEATRRVNALSEETSLPVADPVRHGASVLLDGVTNFLNRQVKT